VALLPATLTQFNRLGLGKGTKFLNKVCGGDTKW